MSMKHRLSSFLLRYRTTPHSTTGISPAELMVKRRLRTRLNLVKPNLAQAVESKQEKQKLYKDTKCNKEREFVQSDKVRVCNMRSKSKVDKWIPGTVVKVCGPRRFAVKTGHKTRYVHSDLMIRAYDDIKPDEVSEQDIEVSESHTMIMLLLAM